MKSAPTRLSQRKTTTLINLDGAVDFDDELEGGKEADKAREHPHGIAKDRQVPVPCACMYVLLQVQYSRCNLRGFLNSVAFSHEHHFSQEPAS